MKKLAKSKPFGTRAHRNPTTERTAIQGLPHGFVFGPDLLLARMRRHADTKAAQTHEGAVHSPLVFRPRAMDTLDSRRRKCILSHQQLLLNLDLAPSHLIVVDRAYRSRGAPFREEGAARKAAHDQVGRAVEKGETQG